MVKLLSDRKIVFFVTFLFCNSFIGCLDDSIAFIEEFIDSDEKVPMFECDNGETIEAYWVNNGWDDCSDGSDEFDPNKVYCDDTKPVFSNEQENVVTDYVYRFIVHSYGGVYDGGTRIGSSVSLPDGLHLTDDGSWDSSGSFELVWDNTDPDYLYWDAQNHSPEGICDFEILETEETGRCVAHANSITYVKIIYNIQHPGQQYYGYTMVNESYWQEAYTTEMSRDYTLAKSNENGQWGIFPEGDFPLAYDCTFDFQGIPDHSIDSDNDGIDDISETEVYGTDSSKNDTDGDGLNDYNELFVHYTNPLVVDTDNDGLTDYFEIYRPDLYGDGGNRSLALDPILPDTDGDGLSDYEEINVLGSDPLNYSGDLDNDGLTDSIEFFIYNTDPNNNDTDGDGIDDIHDYECLSCNGPLSDLDGDGISDDFEFFIYHTNLSNNDTDGDGIDDYSEIYIFSSNPLSNDTDNDGLTDFFEADSYQENQLISLLQNSPCSATFYQRLEASGLLTGPVTFDAGEYDGSKLATYGVDNELVTYWGDMMSAEYVSVDSGCKIIVYDNGDFSGESHILEGEEFNYHYPTNYLGDYFNDQMFAPELWDSYYSKNSIWNENRFSSFKIGGLNDNLENNYASTHQMLYLPERGNSNNKNPMLYYDSDSDGISDGEEVLVLGSYPFSFDSDSDGLSDGLEFIFYNTNASNFDSDYDGVSDFDEIVKYGTDPNQNHNPVVFFKDQLLETNNWFRIEEFYKFDGDGDWFADDWDNCKVNYNPDQMDSDNDGVGDRCEDSGGSGGSSEGRCYWVYDNDDGTKRYQRLHVDKNECSTTNRASWFYFPYPD